jgi:hypothetical protein
MRATSSRRTASLLGLAGLALLAACLPDPGFDERDLVKTPRILAILADKPELAPGESATMSVLFADPRGGGRPVRFRWSACVGLESLGGGGPGFSGAQFGMMEAPPGCGDPGARLTLGEGETAVLAAPPAAQIDLLVAQFRARVGDAIPVDFIEKLLDEVGIQITVQVEALTPGDAGDVTLITGFKRVFVSRRAERGTNPPRPRFAIGEDGVVSAYAPGGAGFDCASESGAPIVVRAGATVSLRPDPTPEIPDDDADDEPWAGDPTCMDADPVTECYGVLDPQGFFARKPESAFYTWNVTAGTLAEGTSSRPTRDNEWTAPTTPGDVTMWLVTRDGHGGTSACRTTLTVR